MSTAQVSSSTQTINLANISHTMCSSGSNKKKQTRKRVRISAESPIVNTILSLEQHTEEEINARWWSSYECDGIRINAQYIAAAARTKSPVMMRMLEETYMNVHEETYKREQDEINEFTNHPPAHLTQHLEKWSAVAHSVRGLERWASGELKAMRAIDARNARDLVLELYYEQCLSDDDVAKSYAEHAKANILYARMSAFADQVAVQKLEQLKPNGKSQAAAVSRDPFLVQEEPLKSCNTGLEAKSTAMVPNPVQQLLRSTKTAPAIALCKGVSSKAA